MKSYSLLLYFSCLSFFVQAQVATEVPVGTKNIAGDCSKAIELKFDKVCVYGPTKAPTSFGKVQEIKGAKGNKMYFEEEHNTAWYTFVCKHDGSITLEVSPSKTTDDYDFMLFKYSDSTFCEKVASQKVKPIRSNISRNKDDLKGITGLSMKAKEDFVGQGLKNAYSRFLEVKKGERYYLVVDNVYSEGSGHSLKLNYKKLIEISGTVVNEVDAPIKADISITDSKGTEVETLKTKEDGTYKLNTYLNENENYTLNFSNDKSFLDTKILNSNNTEGWKDIHTVLPELKKGKSYVFKNINFVAGLPNILSASLSSADALYKLMKRNNKLVISIEGHINGVGAPKDEIAGQQLSEQRANTVFKYLLDKGIDAERMSTYGYGDRKMLFPKAGSEDEMEQNRRVEIKVISF